MTATPTRPDPAATPAAADPVEQMLPTAATLTAAVHDHDPTAVAAILTPLDRTGLYTLAIALASLVQPPAQSELDLGLPADIVDQAVDTAARMFWTEPAALLDGNRTQPALDARHVATYAAHLCGVSYSAIGRALGQDHTTAMHAVGRVGENARLRRIALRVAAECGWDRNAQEVAS